MSEVFGSFCDEFYTSSRLFLKLDLPLERETILHFFDRIRKEFPSMRKFRRRDDGCMMLEEDADPSSPRRWMRLDATSLRFGHFSPLDTDSIRQLGAVILENAPYHLTFSELDYDHLEVVYGFDLEYQGNHDQLVAETFWADHPLASLALGDDAHHVIDAQPYLGIALTPSCDQQAYFEVKSRTSTYEVRTNNFDVQPLSVLLTLRQYWGFEETRSLVEVHQALCDRADVLAADRVVPTLVNPLAQAIASRS